MNRRFPVGTIQGDKSSIQGFVLTNRAQILPQGRI
jgi:hypothetical protein